MSVEKIKAALRAFGELLTALEPFGWDAGPLRARITDAVAELTDLEAASVDPVPPDVGPEPGDSDVLELLAGLEEAVELL